MCAWGKNWNGLHSQDFICKPKSHSQTHQTFESVFLLLVCLLTYIMRAVKNDEIWIKCECCKHLCTNKTPSRGRNQKYLCSGATSHTLGACTSFCELYIVFSTEFS